MTVKVDSIDALSIRARLGRKQWLPPEPFGNDPGMGYLFDSYDERRIIATAWPIEDWGDGDMWLHASISYRDDQVMPTYDDMVLLHHGVWGDGHAYQVFVPPSEHINIRRNVIHLWGRLDGLRELPNFGQYGTI